MPIIETLAIFTLLTAWKDFIWSFIVPVDPAPYTLPMAPAVVSVGQVERMMAASALSVLSMLLYPSRQG